MSNPTRSLPLLLLAPIALSLGASVHAAPFEEARIYIEYNQTPNDLGFHVSLDAEDWKSLAIVNPKGQTIFAVTPTGGYTGLGLTELFFEGAEPDLDEYPLRDLLARFPEGKYKFLGVTVGGARLQSTATLTHNVPDGPNVSADAGGDTVVIRWDPVTTSAAILPNRRIDIVGYQVIVDPFQVTLPATATQVTLPEEFVRSLGPGEHPFEVLAIDVSGNQTITEGTFALTD